MTGGMGVPSLGKLGYDSVAGYGKAFGVQGQGNEATGNVASDTAKNLVIPVQAKLPADCKDSYLYVIVTGTTVQTTVGSTLPLTFEAKAWDENPLLLATRPTATTLLPLARESAKFLAAGVATVAIVAASLY